MNYSALNGMEYGFCAITLAAGLLTGKHDF